MRVALQADGGNDDVAVLHATLSPSTRPQRLSYRTRTGALLRLDGRSAGAFDREHRDAFISPSQEARHVELQVERRSLPTNGLPSGPGLMWRFLNVFARQRPRRELDVNDAAPSARRNRSGLLELLGHSHLDVAWLWTYSQTVRKAQRLFAIACDLLDRDPDFRFIQSQPQLYAFVEENDTELFQTIRKHVEGGRLDAGVAALWVESDCNLPSGESLLRQMLFAHRYCTQRFGVDPQVAWLPDSFGFANTLPQLLAHAGIPYFSTTKLQWNDTTRFPYPQFVWRGPDGSEVVSALIASYGGDAYPWRVRTARRRMEPLVLGYGDGGGGVTAGMLARSQSLGAWTTASEWFQTLAQRRASLPVHNDELYLEYHRGVYTTHHDIKADNALLERALSEAEELLAWSVAVHAPRSAIAELAKRLHNAWGIALRNQFHDVLPGTSITPVYDDVAQEYAQASELVVLVIAQAQAMLPRATVPMRERVIEPQFDGAAFTFENGLIAATVRVDGVLTNLRAANGVNVCDEANVLALYDDRPKAWEAWNVDAGYQATLQRIVPQNARVEGNALAFDIAAGSSNGIMRVRLHDGEPFLRVDVDLDWQERRKLLRVESHFTLRPPRVLYGTPHGTIERSALADTPAHRAQFEVPGQRFGAVRSNEAGAAIFALDTYGWSGRQTRTGTLLGHSLLRSTTWPDPNADRGRHHLSYAFMPLGGASIGTLEQQWTRFAHDFRVRLFTSGDPSVLVVACKPAEDGDGVIVRVRNCDTESRSVSLRCGARMTAVQSVDALERDVDAEASIDGEELWFTLRSFELRSFRVRFSHES